MCSLCLTDLPQCVTNNRKRKANNVKQGYTWIPYNSFPFFIPIVNTILLSLIKKSFNCVYFDSCNNSINSQNINLILKKYNLEKSLLCTLINVTGNFEKNISICWLFCYYLAKMKEPLNTKKVNEIEIIDIDFVLTILVQYSN